MFSKLLGGRRRPAGHGKELASYRDQLGRAGFALRLAARIACDERYDLHALLELVDRGCPPELAARILAPLDDRRKPC